MSSASASTSKPAEVKKTEQAKEDEEAQPHLGVLEEDDEFEEFAVAGSWQLDSPFFSSRLFSTRHR